MQAAKNAAETVKETAANVGASAKSGMEKTKAAVQEKTERMTAHDPMQKEMATQKKEERINQAELEKQEACQHNAAARQSATSAGGGQHMGKGNNTTGTGGRQGPYTTGNGSATYSTTGEYGQPMGTHQMSAMPGHGTGHPMGNVTDGVVGSHPIGTETGTGRTTTAHNTRVDGNAPGYATGGAGGTYN